MSCERASGNIVTEFLMSTCRLRSKPCKQAVEAAVICGQLAAATLSSDDIDRETIPLMTGSVDEFYIEPMLPDLGDIDVMYHYNTMLAIPRGHPPPTQLPVEFNDYVRVFEIVDSHLPGYVYLPLRYLLTECSNDDNYNAVKYDSEDRLVNDSVIVYENSVGGI